jgi:uncharacterized protein YcfL
VRASLLVFILAIPACGSTSSASDVVETRTTTGETRYIQGSEDLVEILEVMRDSILIRRNPETNFLETQVSLFNKTEDTVRFEYRWDWYDERGFQLKVASAHWTPDQIYGRQELFLQGTAPDPLASTFRISVRRPQELK